MLPQEQMIESVRRLCESDAAVSAAAMYGSFARGEGDEFSDIEFYLFVDDTSYDTFDLDPWIREIAPVDECFLNDFGTTVALDERYVELIRALDDSPIANVSRPFTFVGSTRQQIVNAVESQDIRAFDLERLYQLRSAGGRGRCARCSRNVPAGAGRLLLRAASTCRGLSITASRPDWCNPSALCGVEKRFRAFCGSPEGLH